MHPVRMLLASLALVVTGCGGGGGGSSTPLTSNLTCDSNAQGIQLARPAPSQAAVPTTTTTVEIVDDGDGDQLFTLTNQFILNVTDNTGAVIRTGMLSEVPDPTGPHPYLTNSIFYAGTLTQSLQPGRTYAVSLDATSVTCTPLPIGTFST
jgi:hypothetical protein